MPNSEVSTIKAFYDTYPDLRGVAKVWDWVQGHSDAVDGLIRVNHTGLRRRCVRRLRDHGDLPEVVVQYLVKISSLWSEGSQLQDDPNLWLFKHGGSDGSTR